MTGHRSTPGMGLGGALWLVAVCCSMPVAAWAQRPAPAVTAAWDSATVAAERAMTQGDRATASALAQRIIAVYERSSERAVVLSSRDHILAGRAYLLLPPGDANTVRAALRAFDRATALDSTNVEGQRRAGDLFLDKYNAPDARVSYERILATHPTETDALLGLARVEDFEGKPTALQTVRRALAAQPRHVPSLAFAARLFLESEALDSARHYALQAVVADSQALEAWSVLGATALVAGDSALYRRALRASSAMQPRPTAFFTELAEATVRQRRYADAVRLAEQAVAYDSLNARALGVLGTNQLRTAQLQAGRRALERAFALDPFNLWHKNALDLLDKMDGFQTIRQGRFELVAPKEEAPLLAVYLLPMLEQAFDTLQLRYGYAPPTPVRLEFFRQHADFSVRTLGLTGLGALGVSFGSFLALDAPSARDRGTFNWGSTSWHELTHAFTLGASSHRVPRWFSEGLSVLEERRALPGWGARVSPGWLTAMRTGMVQPVSGLNDGFLRPRTPEETQNSYIQASLFCEWVEQTKGARALPAMLVAYRDGRTTAEVVQRVLGLSLAQVDTQFDTWVRQRFAADLANVPARGVADGGPFVVLMREALALEASRPDSARRLLQQADQLMPEYAGDDGPAWHLARLALTAHDTTAALRFLSVVIGRNETAWDANLLDAALREARGDRSGAIAALERLVWMWPYDITVLRRLAVLAAAHGDWPRAVRARRAVVANRPADLLDARYELARALAGAGAVAEARQELLQLLEEAPSFEQAQLLLLELRRGGGE